MSRSTVGHRSTDHRQRSSPLAPNAATRPSQIKPKLVVLLPHPIALALTPGGLACWTTAAPRRVRQGRAAPDRRRRHRCAGRYSLAAVSRPEPAGRFRARRPHRRGQAARRPLGHRREQPHQTHGPHRQSLLTGLVVQPAWRPRPAGRRRNFGLHPGHSRPNQRGGYLVAGARGPADSLVEVRVEIPGEVATSTRTTPQMFRLDRRLFSATVYPADYGLCSTLWPTTAPAGRPRPR
jgi:hypothetical protein